MLKVGKLDSDVLQRVVIDKIKHKRPEVKIRAGIGQDCGVVDFGEYECVISTDPITATVDQIGRLCIHISCNDIASNGIEPLAIFLTVLLPEGTMSKDVEKIMAQAAAAAKEANVEIAGGHTEVTNAVNQPVIVSTAFGRGAAGQSQNAANMKPGDYILMTKSAGLEGTGILAGDFADKLEGALTVEEIAYADSLLKKVSVVKEGIIAGRIGTSGMHDVTEGGVLGALWEMCHVAGLGARVCKEDIAVEKVTEKIADYFQIDYLRLISSGVMLIMASPEKKDQIMDAVGEAGIQINCIGRVCEKSQGLFMDTDSGEIEIKPSAVDELYKVVQ